MANTLTSANSFNLNDSPYSGTFYSATLTGASKTAQAHTTGTPSGGTGDTLVASSTASNSTLFGGSHSDSLVALGANVRLVQNSTGNDTLVGNATTTFQLGAASLLGNNSLKGAGANGLLIGSAGTLNDSFTRMSGIGSLSLTGASSVSLGANAQAAKLSKVFAGAGDTTFTQLAGDTLATTLIGSTGNDRYVQNTPINLWSLDGGSGIDTVDIAYQSTLTDAAFVAHKNMDVLELTGSSAVTLGVNASRAGYTTIVGGNGPTTVNGAADTNTLTINTSANSLGGDLITASNKNDLIIVNGKNFGTETVNGGTGIDTLRLANAATLNDSFANIKRIEGLAVTSPSSVTLSSAAAAAGINSVFGGAGSDSFTQLAGDTLATTFVGGAGSDTFAFANQTLFAADSIAGGADTLDTIQFLAPVTLNDGFTRVTGVEVLSLNGSSQVTLGANATATGINSVIGGTGPSTINAWNDTLNMTFDMSRSNPASSLGGDSIVGSFLGTNNFIIQGTLASTGAETIRGGIRNDTITVLGSSTLDDNFLNVRSVEVLTLDSLGGSAAVTLGANSSQAGFRTVIGGAGDDTLVQTSANTTRLTLAGGDGNDSISVFSSSQLAGDSIAGGIGTDTLQIGSSAYINDAFTKVSSIEVLQLTSQSSVTLNGNARSAEITKVYGGDGSDTFTVLESGSGTLFGGGDNDLFRLMSGDQLLSSSVIGGLGTDTLTLLDPRQYVTSFATGVTGVEVLSLSGGDNEVTLSGSSFSTVIGGSNNDKFTEAGLGDVQIAGNGGTDTVAVTGAVSSNDAFGSLTGIEVLSLGAASQLTLASGAVAAGIQSIVGSNAGDSFAEATTTSFAINGGASDDTLSLTQDSQSISDFSKISSVEVFKTANGNNLVDLTTAAAAGVSTVIGGSGNDSFTAATTTSFAIEGGAGSDTVALTTAGTVNDFSRLSNIDALKLANGSNTVDLTAAGANQFSTVVGGTGADAFTEAVLGDFQIAGGKGIDTVALTNSTYTEVTDDQFTSVSSIEVIQAGSGYTTFTLGSAAQTAGVSSIIGGTASGAYVKVENTYNRSLYFDASASSNYSGVQFANAQQLAASTLKGTNSTYGNDFAININAPATIGDSAFNNKSNTNALYFYPTYGHSQVTLGSAAAAAGVDYVRAQGPGSGQGSSMTVVQTADHTLATNLVGGDEGDRFQIATASQIAADTFNGNNGTDTLAVGSDSQTLTAGDFANVTNVEVLSLSGGNNVVDLTGGEGAPFSTVIGGSGNDLFAVGNLGTIDIQGGAGIDTVAVVTSGSIADTQFGALSSIEVLQTANSLVYLGKDARNAGISSLISAGGDSAVVVGADFTTPLYVDGSSDTLNFSFFDNGAQFANSTLIGSTLNSSFNGGDAAFIAGTVNLNDRAFASKSNLDALFLTGDVNLTSQSGKYNGSGINPGTSSVILGQNAMEAGLSLVGATSSSGKYNQNATAASAPGQVLITQTAANTLHSALYGGAGNDTFVIATESQVTNDTISGNGWTNSSKYSATVKTETETNTLVFGRTDLPVVYTNAANDIGFDAGGLVAKEQYTQVQSLDNPVAVYNTLGDSAFANVSGIQVLSLQGTNSGVVLGSLSAATGIQTVYGSASGSTIFQDQTLQPHCGTPTGLDIIGQNGNDYIALADAGFLAYNQIDGGRGVNTLGVNVLPNFIPPVPNNLRGIPFYSTLGDQSFANVRRIQNLEILSDYTSVTLAGNAFNAGISTVTASTGDTVMTAWNVDSSRNLTLDAGNSDGFNFLIGQTALGLGFNPNFYSTLPVYPLNTNEFIFANGGSTLGTSTVIGGVNIDTLYINNDSCEGANVTDSNFQNVHLVEALALNGNAYASLGSLASGTNSSKYNFGSGGISTVYGGVDYNSLGNTFGNTIVQESSWSTLRDLTIIGGQGDDSISVANTTLLGNDSIYGGEGNDTLQIGGGFTLNDSFPGSVSGIEALQLSCATGGEGVGSAITLGSAMASIGLSSVYGSDCDDTIVQNSGDTLPTYIAANEGNDTISVGTVSILGNNTIDGGVGTDTLQINSDGTYADSLFANVSNIEVLTTSTTNSGYTKVTLGSAAMNAGISSVIAGSNSTYGLKITQAADNTTALYIDGSASGSYNSFTFANGGQFASSTLVGSTLAASNGGGNAVIFQDTVSLSDDAFANKSGFGYNEGEIYLHSDRGGAGSSVTLGSNAQTMNFSEVYGGWGSDTLIHTADDTLGIEFYTNSSYTSNGYLSVANPTLLGNDTFVGNSTSPGGFGIDTLELRTSSSNYNFNYDDSLFGNITNVEVVKLTGSSYFTSVSLGTNAQNAGISTVVAADRNFYGSIDASSMTSAVYIDGTNSSYSMTLTGGSGNDTILGGSYRSNVLTGGEGSDLISVEYNSNYTVSGGGGTDTLQIRNGDNNFVSIDDWSDITSIEALSLEGGAVTLNASASLAGFTDVYLTGSLGGSVYQASDDSLSINFHGSDGGDLFTFANTSLLGNDTVTGNGGIDTIGFSSAATLTDAAFTNVTGIDVLTLTGPSSVTFLQAGAAQLSGLSSIYGGNSTLGDTINVQFTGDRSLFVGGGNGPDLINAGGGKNTLQGWNGLSSSNTANDSMTNGGGTDFFILGDTLANAYGNTLGAVAYVNNYTQASDRLVLHNFGNGAEDYALSTLAGPYNLNINVKNGGSLVSALYVNGRNTATFFNSVDFQYGQSSLGSGASVTGGNGNDLFVIPNATLLADDTINGVSGTDTLTVVGKDNYADSVFSGVSNMKWFVADNGGSVTLGSDFQNTGIASIAAGTDSNYSLNVTQTASDTLPTYFNGTGSGKYGNSFTVANDTQLGNNTLIGSATANDTLNLGGSSGGAHYNDSVFSNVSSFEVLTTGTSSSYNNVTLGSSAQSAGIASVIGGAAYGNIISVDGSDTLANYFDLSATSHQAGIRFDNGVQFGASTVIGSSYAGTNSGSSYNWVTVRNAATLGDESFANKSAVNALYLDDANSGSSAVTLGGNAAAAGINYVEAYSGDDTITQNNVTATSIFGGSGNDLFNLLGSSLNALLNDTLNGNNDIDTLNVGGAATLADTAFVNVSNFENLWLSGGEVTLGASAALAGFTLASASSSTLAESFYVATGNLDIIGSSLGDSFTMADSTVVGATTITGGDGTDTLNLQGGFSYADSLFGNVSTTEVLNFLNSADTLNDSLTSATLGAAANAAGFTTVFGSQNVSNEINATADTLGQLIVGGNYSDTLSAGTGSDTLQAWIGSSDLNRSSDTMTGGNGADHFVLGDTLGNAYGDNTGAVAYIRDFDQRNDYLYLHNFGSSGATGATAYSYAQINDNGYNFQVIHDGTVVAKLNVQNLDACCFLAGSNVKYLGTPACSID